MKVLTHEADSLSADRRREVNALKKAHYRLCCEQLETLNQARKLKGLNTRLAVLSLFGMMNWIYSWYEPTLIPMAKRRRGRCRRFFCAAFLCEFEVSGRRTDYGDIGNRHGKRRPDQL